MRERSHREGALRDAWKRLPLLLALLTTALAGPLLLAACGASGAEVSPSPSSSPAAVTREQVVALVDLTCAALAEDVPGTLAAINAGRAPFVDQADPELYAYVCDDELTVVAHPNSEIVGQNNVGKPDPTGRYYRDEMLKGAHARGSGWVEYVYAKPGADGLFLKEARYQRTTGGDGATYIVSAGRYLGPWTSPGPTPAATP